MRVPRNGGRVRPEYAEKFAAAILAGDWCACNGGRAREPLYWKLLHAAGESTGLPVLYNTVVQLFGERWFPTRRTPCVASTPPGIDAMFGANFFLQK